MAKSPVFTAAQIALQIAALPKTQLAILAVALSAAITQTPGQAKFNSASNSGLVAAII